MLKPTNTAQDAGHQQAQARRQGTYADEHASVPYTARRNRYRFWILLVFKGAFTRRQHRFLGWQRLMIQCLKDLLHFLFAH